MGTNVFGFESHAQPLGDHFLHATVVPIDDGHLSVIEVEVESKIIYRRALRFPTADLARMDLTTQLRFMKDVTLEDLQRAASYPTDDEFLWTTHRDLSAKLKKEEAEEDGEFDTHVPNSIEDPRPKLHYLSELELTTSFVRQAGSTENYLQSLGVQPAVIQFVSQQPTDVAKKLVNEVRKNNALTVDQLQEMAQGLANKQKYEPTRLEMRLAHAERYDQIPGMTEWVLLQLKRHRGQRREVKNNPYSGFPSYEFMYTIPATGEDFPCPLTGQMANDLIRLLLQIADWVRSTGAQISSYDLNTAKAASDQWHEEQAAQGGAGQGYQEKNVVYTLKNGWTIQEVRTDNDLQVEGNLMGHCVGSYCTQVSSGNSSIYSLRDPKNEPHATVEMSGGGLRNQPLEGEVAPFEVVQIQGKENREPIPEYKAMIKEWFMSLGIENVAMSGNGEGIYDRLYNAEPEEMADLLQAAVDRSDENDYGIPAPVEQFNSQSMEHIYEHIENRLESRSRRDNSYHARTMQPIAEALADLAWNSDMREVQSDPRQWSIALLGDKPLDPQQVMAMYEKSRSAMSGLQRRMDEHQEEFDKWEPDWGFRLEDFEDEEKLLEAESQARDEAYSEWRSGGLDIAINRRWHELAEMNGGKYPWTILEERLRSGV